ncbi:MAG: metal-dependent hydrolase [Nitrospirota bacterium]
MPSPIAHAVSGYAISRLLPPKQPIVTGQDDNKEKIYIAYCILLANLPDFDFIPQLLTGQRYHHGFTHSLIFTIGISMTLGLLSNSILETQGFKQSFFLTLIIYGSHLLMDFFTAGGKGMQLLWPFSDGFFISPIAIFPGVYYSKGLFHYSHLIFIGFELVYSVILLRILWFWEKRRY